jgi:hypothetical protein
LSKWSDDDIFRAVRNAMDPDGRCLVMMSYTNADKLSDEDTRAVIAYLRSLTTARHPTATPPDRFKYAGLDDVLSRPISTGVVTAPPKGPTSRFGELILSYQDCRGCHGSEQTGGTPGLT